VHELHRLLPTPEEHAGEVAALFEFFEAKEQLFVFLVDGRGAGSR